MNPTGSSLSLLSKAMACVLFGSGFLPHFRSSIPWIHGPLKIFENPLVIYELYPYLAALGILLFGLYSLGTHRIRMNVFYGYFGLFILLALGITWGLFQMYLPGDEYYRNIDIMAVWLVVLVPQGGWFYLKMKWPGERSLELGTMALLATYSFFLEVFQVFDFHNWDFRIESHQVGLVTGCIASFVLMVSLVMDARQSKSDPNREPVA